jgi:hypothetical protein
MTAVLLLTAGLMLLPVDSHVNVSRSNVFVSADGTGPTPPPPPGSDNFVSLAAMNA